MSGNRSNRSPKKAVFSTICANTANTEVMAGNHSNRSPKKSGETTVATSHRRSCSPECEQILLTEKLYKVLSSHDILSFETK